MPLVPDHDTAGAVLAFRDLAFEAAVVERVVLDLHGQPPVLGIQARLFRHGPALEHAVVLEPEVVVEPRRIVFLHDELQAAVRCAFARAAGLGCSREIALIAIARELAA